MKKLLLPLLLLNAKAQQAILVDTHNDVLSNELINHEDISKLQTTGQFDLVRAKHSELDCQSC